jgi:hypothetical protein
MVRAQRIQAAPAGAQQARRRAAGSGAGRWRRRAAGASAGVREGRLTGRVGAGGDAEAGAQAEARRRADARGCGARLGRSRPDVDPARRRAALGSQNSGGAGTKAGAEHALKQEQAQGEQKWLHRAGNGVRGAGGVGVRAQERDPSGGERPRMSSGAQGGFRRVSSSAMRAKDVRGSGVRGWR